MSNSFSFGRYWSHTQDLREIITRISGISRHAPFPKFSKVSTSNILRFPQIIFFKMVRISPLILWNNVVAPRSSIIGVWESWSCPLGEKLMNIRTFRFLGKSNRKAIIPKWSRILLRSVWPTLALSKLYSNNAPRPTQTQIRMSFDFLYDISLTISRLRPCRRHLGCWLVFFSKFVWFLFF